MSGEQFTRYNGRRYRVCVYPVYTVAQSVALGCGATASEVGPAQGWAGFAESTRESMTFMGRVRLWSGGLPV
jgi:hypothetical protein